MIIHLILNITLFILPIIIFLIAILVMKLYYHFSALKEMGSCQLFFKKFKLYFGLNFDFSDTDYFSSTSEYEIVLCSVVELVFDNDTVETLDWSEKKKKRFRERFLEYIEEGYDYGIL